MTLQAGIKDIRNCTLLRFEKLLFQREYLEALGGERSSVELIWKDQLVGERYHRVHFETLRIFCFVLGFEVLCGDAWKLLDCEPFLFDHALWLERVRQAVIVFDASTGRFRRGNCLIFLSRIISWILEPLYHRHRQPSSSRDLALASQRLASVRVSCCAPPVLCRCVFNFYYVTASEHAVQIENERHPNLPATY